MQLTAVEFWVSGVSGDALTDGLMVSSIAQSIHSAPLDVARVVAHLRFLVTISVVRAVAVCYALGFSFSDAVAVEV